MRGRRCARWKSVGFAGAVAVLDDLAAVECTLVGDAAGDGEGADVGDGDAAGGSDEAAATRRRKNSTRSPRTRSGQPRR